MDNTLMKVTQLPVIEEHLRSRKEQTEQRVAEAISLVCTDETLTSVKNIRAEMNREFADAETQRKAIKAAIMEKYDSFEAVYRECIADPYKRADADLKAKIDATENEIKSRCEETLLAYFQELCAVNEIDFLSFGQTGVKVDMASARAKTPKKLMEQIKLKVDGVAQDTKTIGTMGENAPEIMVEYKKNLDLSLAISVVNERHRRAEEETYDIVFGSQEWQDLDRGIITREEANKIMLEKAAHANRVFEVQTCLDEWFTMLETNKTTVQIMRKLKAAGYRLYYLTNIPTDVMDELRQREWFSLFDGGIASCDVHLCKPEPEIFTTLMQTCHLAYDESIFVDDNKANAQAAYNLGITGILYKNPKSFTRALGACGIEVE